MEDALERPDLRADGGPGRTWKSTWVVWRPSAAFRLRSWRRRSTGSGPYVANKNVFAVDHPTRAIPADPSARGGRGRSRRTGRVDARGPRRRQSNRVDGAQMRGVLMDGPRCWRSAWARPRRSRAWKPTKGRERMVRVLCSRRRSCGSGDNGRPERTGARHNRVGLKTVAPGRQPGIRSVKVRWGKGSPGEPVGLRAEAVFFVASGALNAFNVDYGRAGGGSSPATANTARSLVEPVIAGQGGGSWPARHARRGGRSRARGGFRCPGLADRPPCTWEYAGSSTVPPPGGRRRTKAAKSQRRCVRCSAMQRHGESAACPQWQRVGGRHRGFPRKRRGGSDLLLAGPNGDVGLGQRAAVGPVSRCSSDGRWVR